MNNKPTTERLRELLDERGIEYQMYKSNTGTRFFIDYCEQCEDYLKSIEIVGSCIVASQGYLSPEQAIDIILGTETCEVKKNTDDYGWYCECGNFFPPSVPPRNYCPNCGRKVVN